MRQTAPETLPARLYREAAIYETERREIFARSWQLLAHESQFARPGDYMATTFAGFPLVAVKGEDGRIRAFHNVCRHRAGPLVDDGAGHCAGAFVCRYHAWKYALDGRLASARDFGPADGFDPRDFSLYPLKCEIWRGFVFVNMDRDAPPLEEAIAPLENRMRHLAPERFRRARLSSHDIACNWKTYVENYLEGYHIPIIHPTLTASIAADYGTELEPPAIFYRATPKNDAAVAGLWAWAWPCLGVNVYADGILMERMWPMGVEKTRLDYLFLFAEDADEADIERQIAASVVTTKEDVLICEAVQRNLDAGIYQTGRLSPKHEAGVAWFQQEVGRALGA
jgi:choline monooxygenase